MMRKHHSPQFKTIGQPTLERDFLQDCFFLRGLM